MIPFPRLLKYLPNIAELPRDTFISFTNEDTGFLYSTLYNEGRNSFLGLDMTVNNESGSQATFSLDGRSYWVLDAGIRTLTNIPFNQFLIGATGATPNRIDCTVFGCSMQYIEELTGHSIYELVYHDYPTKPAPRNSILSRLLIGDRA